MFKKPLKAQTTTMLTGKDRKAFIESLKKSMNPVAIDAFFKDNEAVQIEKLKGSKQIIYTSDYPAFVDATGKGDLFPTLYIVAEYPTIVGEISVKESVESLVLGGGNLMWEGIDTTKTLGDFNKDDVRAIYFGGKLIALGAMGSESKNIDTAEPAAYILHTVQDQLWEYGPKQLTPAKPQFIRKSLVVEQKQVVKPPQEDVFSSSDDEKGDDLSMLMGGLKNKQALKKQAKKPEAPKKIIQKDDSSDDDKKKKKVTKKKEAKKPTEEQEERKDQQAMPTKVMDEYLKEAFMNSIKVGVNDKDLPMDANIFLTQFLMSFKKQNVELDIKNSSYGKIGKFLQHMSKDGLIEYKEGKKGAQSQIESIDRTTEQYESWEPTVLKAQAHQEVHEESKDSQSYNLNVEVVQMYKPDGPLSGLFEAKDKEDNYWTADEVKKAILKKCQVDKKVITVKDAALLQLIAEGDEDEDEDHKDSKDKDADDENKKKKRGKKSAKDQTTQEVLMAKVYENLTKFYQITNPNTKKTEFKSGEFKGLQLIAEKQQSKNVTVLTGLELFGFDHTLKADNIYNPNHLLNVLQEKLSCQGTVQNGKQILLQGIFVDDINDFLVNECKVKQDYIHQNNKIAAKKKPQSFNK